MAASPTWLKVIPSERLAVSADFGVNTVSAWPLRSALASSVQSACDGLGLDREVWGAVLGIVEFLRDVLGFVRPQKEQNAESKGL